MTVPVRKASASIRTSDSNFSPFSMMSAISENGASDAKSAFTEEDSSSIAPSSTSADRDRRPDSNCNVLSGTVPTLSIGLSAFRVRSLSPSLWTSRLFATNSKDLQQSSISGAIVPLSS